MSKKKTRPQAATIDPPAAVPTEDPSSSACLRFGWVMLAVFLTLGLVLEAFHLVKLPFYLDVRLRRELWTLAHTHGTLFGAVNILFGLSALRRIPNAARRALASKLLRVGALMVPTGFLLGGVGAAEGDPSLAIVLVPVGALLALVAVVMTATRSS